MLVLSRKTTESLIINMGERNAEVQVLRINGRRVTLGITAPADVPITRPAARMADVNFPGRPR